MNVVEVLLDACQLNTIDVRLAHLFVVLLGHDGRVDALIRSVRVDVGSIRADHASICSYTRRTIKVVVVVVRCCNTVAAITTTAGCAR